MSDHGKNSESSFSIIRLVGKGRLGGVYLVKADESGKTGVMRRFFDGEGRAIIQSKDDFLEWAQRLEGASQQVASLPTVYEYGWDEDGAFLVTELIEGEKFVDILREGPLSAEDILRLAQDVILAFDAGHSHGLIHGYLDGGSLMRLKAAQEGETKFILTDLGLGLLADTVADESVFGLLGKSESGLTLKAPERKEGTAASEVEDLFSLGQLLIVAAAGGHPLSGLANDEIGRKLREGDYPRIGDFRRDLLDDFVKWADSLVAVEPNQRPQSSQAAYAFLMSALTSRDLTSSNLEKNSEVAKRGPKPLAKPGPDEKSGRWSRSLFDEAEQLVEKTYQGEREPEALGQVVPKPEAAKGNSRSPAKLEQSGTAGSGVKSSNDESKVDNADRPPQTLKVQRPGKAEIKAGKGLKLANAGASDQRAQSSVSRPEGQGKAEGGQGAEVDSIDVPEPSTELKAHMSHKKGGPPWLVFVLIGLILLGGVTYLYIQKIEDEKKEARLLDDAQNVQESDVERANRRIREIMAEQDKKKD